MGTDSKPSYVGLRKVISDRVPLQARVIVDVGAADGTLARFLREGRTDRVIIGIEKDPQLAARAEQWLDEVHVADAGSIEWDAVAPGHQVDCLVFADVLEHLQDPWTVIGQASERLTVDGTVVVSVPNIRHVTALWQIFVRGRFPRRSRGLFDETHLRWFTSQDVRCLCEQAGLMVSSTHYELRLTDRPGGLLNRAVSIHRWVARVPVLRDLLAYQVVLTASLSTSE